MASGCQVPATPEFLQENFYDRFAMGCPIIETDITNALLNMLVSYNWREISVLQDLADTLQKQAPDTDEYEGVGKFPG